MLRQNFFVAMLMICYQYITPTELSEDSGKSIDSDSLTRSEAITYKDLKISYIVGFPKKIRFYNNL